MSKLLFKYYSPNALTDEYIDTLKSQQFWFGTNRIQNDPYDLVGADEFFNNYIGKNILQYINDHDGNVQLMRNHIMQFASCSFSRVATDRLMWAHYAQSFSGFCLAFSFEEKAPLNIVTYVDKYPITGQNFSNSIDLNIVEILNAWIKNPQPTIINKLVTYLASIKSQEWVYEQEERLIDIVPTKSVGRNMPWTKYHAKVNKIIFGSNFQHQNHGGLMCNMLANWRLCKTDLYQIRTNALMHFEINMSPLSPTVINKYYSQLP